MSSAPFANLEQLLLRLGFARISVPGSHLLFEHTGADVRVLLRPYGPEEQVDAAALAYVRRTLDAWGILDKEQFEDQLRQRSLAG
jgi:predicted RNA binding protein YcfA (HicA-like mRNA interferase family)